MAEPVIISATKANGQEVAYIGTIGDDGYVYFNDSMFYRFKPEGTWEQNLYVLNRWRHSWMKCSMFTKLSAQNLNAGGGSVAPGGQGVENAIQWALAIARDNSHGYDQGSRWGLITTVQVWYTKRSVWAVALTCLFIAVIQAL